jgi:hypothetical protein
MKFAWFRVSLAGAASLAAVIGLGVTSAVASNVQGVSYSYASVKSSGPNKCMDIPNGSKSNGEYVQQWTCNAESQQEWVRIQTLPTHGGYLSNAKPFLIQNTDTGKCLSVLNNSNSPGTSVIQWPCNFSGSDLYELWFNWPFETPPAAGFLGYFSLGQEDSSSHPLDAIHPSGNGLSNGLHLYVNTPSGNAYFWYQPPLVIPAG